VNAFDIAVVALAGLAGWFLVSWLFTLGKPRTPAQPGSSSAQSPTTQATPSLVELAEQWHRILNVTEDSSFQMIEARYREALADCDRIRASALSSSLEIASAEARQRAVTRAYEFIRAARKAEQRQKVR
jgi:hypothetical protein